MKSIFTTLLCSCLYFSSLGWGVTGHRVVGEIAYRHLNDKAKERVNTILNGASMAIVSNWPDFVRSDKSYQYLAPWHYVNVTDGLSESAFKNILHTNKTADVYTQTQFLIGQLKAANAPKDSMTFYLTMLIHLVGDAHQPMHAGRTKDFGGNKISIIWFKDTSNLHKVWDDDLINFQQLSYTEYASAIDLPAGRDIASLQQAPPDQWVYESYALSQQLYAEITSPYQRLSYVYNYDHIQQINDRLYTAGIRLAAVLNDLFGS